MISVAKQLIVDSLNQRSFFEEQFLEYVEKSSQTIMTFIRTGNGCVVYSALRDKKVLFNVLSTNSENRLATFFIRFCIALY